MQEWPWWLATPWKTAALEDGRGAGLGLEMELNSFYSDSGGKEKGANEFRGLQQGSQECGYELACGLCDTGELLLYFLISFLRRYPALGFRVCSTNGG